MKLIKLGNFIIWMAFSALIASGCSPIEGNTSLPPSTTPQSTTIVKDITFASALFPEANDQSLDIYIPEEGRDWPVVVFLHGIGTDKESYSVESQAISRDGFIVFTPNWPVSTIEVSSQYRLAADVLACAVKFARSTAADYGGDASILLLVGHSAGAKRGAMFALGGDQLLASWQDYASEVGEPDQQIECTRSDYSANVDGFIGIAGRYQFLQGLKDRDEALWKIVSTYAQIGLRPELQIRLLHGKSDNTVPPEFSSDFNEALTIEGYDVTLTFFDGAHIVPFPLTNEILHELVSQLLKDGS